MRTIFECRKVETVKTAQKVLTLINQFGNSLHWKIRKRRWGGGGGATDARSHLGPISFIFM